MSRFNIYYAMLVTCQHGKSSSTTRYFTGHNLKAIRQVLSSLAQSALGNATCRPLQTGIWTIHDTRGVAVEAHTFSDAPGARWRKVPRGTLEYYDLNESGLRMARLHCDTIGADGTITENHKS